MTTDILKTYETSDIILAAVMKVKGLSLYEITITGNKGFFHFTDVPRELLFEYDIGKILVEPVAFNMQIKNLTTAVRRLVKG